MSRRASPAAMPQRAVPRPRAHPDAEALLAHCRERLARYKLPAQWHFAESLPKNAGQQDRQERIMESMKS